ncbi:MAG TPA: response regulator [Methanoregula sp.]|nr:response regulator [Methanoregula sp.]
MDKISVLVVEDDNVMARIAEMRLASLGYHMCARATSAKEAIEAVVCCRPDIVLMDINILGDVDGIDTAVMIKKGFKIPVIYATSHTDEATLERAKASNADGFIAKPYKDDNIRVAIELALKK